ncbi:ABC transporter permease [Paenibacillus favisporus]|uniref:ABC transporter permease n=1 Tax=Paenibacillus favisporus TaxID=221028 RepID=UPI00339588FF
MRNHVLNFIKYKDLFIELVKKDIKLKYKNSYLGILWSLINPLMMMVVLTIVFSAIFRNHIENFPVYVLTGRLIYSFFSEATNFSMDSINANSQLIKKVYVPKYFFPLSRVCSSFITTLIAMLPIFVIMLVTNMKFHATILLIWVPLLILLFLSMGAGLILATITVFFKDMKHLYSIVLTVVMYMTPIFYPANIIPEKYHFLIRLNPLYSVLNMFRDNLMYGKLPTLTDLLLSIIYAVLFIFIGFYMFYKKQDKFIFHL